MRATAHLEVARRGGLDRLVAARSEPPFAIRATPERVLVVGSSAAPVGGDELQLDVVVGPGARARVGTAAATVVWPGPPPGGHGCSPWSSMSVRLSVGDGGHLEWAPEPTVPVVGSRHRSRTTLDLTGTATARLVEEVSLGRSGEPPGRIDLELRVARDGTPLVHHTERLGPDVPGWGSVVHVGAARHLVTMIEVGPVESTPGVTVGPADAVEPGVMLARLPVGDDVLVTLAVGPDRPSTRRALCGEWR